MTIEAYNPRVTFAGDGSTTSFDLGSTFVFYDDTDLIVEVVMDSTGVSETLTLNVDYTVSGGSGSTGTVDTSGGSSPHGAPASGKTLVVRLSLSILQQDDYVNGAISDAEVIEDRMDRLTLYAQQLDEVSGRALRAPPSEDSVDNLPTRAARRNKYFKFDDTVDAKPEAVAVTELASGAVVLDEDDFGSDSDTDAPSQQSTDVYTVNNGDFAAKGDVIAGTAAGAHGTVTAGTDGQFLQADSGEAAGVKWNNGHNVLGAKSGAYTVQSSDLGVYAVIPIDISAGSVTITELALGSMSGIVEYVVVADDAADTSTKEAILNDSAAAEVWTGVRKGDFIRVAYDGTNRRVLDHRESHEIQAALTADQSITAGSAAQLTGFTNLRHFGSVFESNAFTSPFDCIVTITTYLKAARSSVEIRAGATPSALISTLQDTSSINATAIALAAMDPTSVHTWPRTKLAKNETVEMWVFDHDTDTNDTAKGDGVDETQIQITLRRLY